MWPSWKKSLILKPLEAVLIKTSLVDYPQRVAAACFLRGCNFRCPYCYNTELVEPSGGNQSQAQKSGDCNCLQAQKSGAQAKRDNPQFVSIQDVIAHLKKRANVLSGFVISGGEPLCQPDAVRGLILEARSLGYKIKLDTNGAFPDRLQELLSDPACAPDYVALDVKTAPAHYSELLVQNAATGKDLQDLNAAANALQAKDTATVKALQDLNAGGQDCSQDLNAAPAGSLAFKASQAQNAAAEKIIESIKIVSALPADAREFRTVLYPPLVSESEINKIASLLPKDARWYFAHFLNGHCLSAAAEKVQPYTEEKEAALLELARSFIPGAELR